MEFYNCNFKFCKNCHLSNLINCSCQVKFLSKWIFYLCRNILCCCCKKGTGNEVVVIENLDDILNGAEEIFTKFGYVLSETAILTEEEKSKFSKNLNNIEGKFL